LFPFDEREARKWVNSALALAQSDRRRAVVLFGAKRLPGAARSLGFCQVLQTRPTLRAVAIGRPY
jgi:hypothetical protein